MSRRRDEERGETLVASKVRGRPQKKGERRGEEKGRIQSRKRGCSGRSPSAMACSPKRLLCHTDILRMKSLAGTVGSGLGNLMPLYLILKLNMAFRDTCSFLLSALHSRWNILTQVESENESESGKARE